MCLICTSQYYMTILRFTVTFIQTSWTISVSRTGWWIFVTSVEVSINSWCVNLCLINGIYGDICCHCEMTVESVSEQRNICTTSCLIADWLYLLNCKWRFNSIRLSLILLWEVTISYRLSVSVLRLCKHDKEIYTTFIFLIIGWFSVLPLKWEQDCHVNGDGRNLVVLLNSTRIFQLSSVRVVTEMVSITISLTSEVDRNCCDARHVELQGLAQISSQTG